MSGPSPTASAQIWVRMPSAFPTTVSSASRRPDDSARPIVKSTLGPLIAASATAYTALKVVGAGYLVWLGVQAIRHRRALSQAFETGVPIATPSLHAVRAGYVVGVTNPKTVVFFAALLPQFVVQSSPVLVQLVALGTVFAVLALLMDGTVALAASRARDWFASSPRRMERVGGAGGLMMVGLGTGLLLTGRPAD